MPRAQRDDHRNAYASSPSPSPPHSHSVRMKRIGDHSAHDASTTAASATLQLAIDDSDGSKLSSISATSSVWDLSMRSMSTHSSHSTDNASDMRRVVDSGHRTRLERKSAATATRTDATYTSRRRQRPHPRPSPTATASKKNPQKPSSSSSSSLNQTEELEQIQQSVDRLRAQRTYVEQLRHHNEQIEESLSQQTKQNEKLRSQVASLQGVEQENRGLFKSFQLLEERIRTLEAACKDRNEELRMATDRAAALEKERDRLHLHCHELRTEKEQYKQQLVVAQSTEAKRIEQLEMAHENALEKLRRSQRDWQAKAKEAQQFQSSFEHKYQDELTLLRQENQQFVRESGEMEQRVQQLLATTVRQTTMIEDCDHALSESRRHHATTTTSYHDQVQVDVQLKDQIHQLEIKLATGDQTFAIEKKQFEKHILDLQKQVENQTDKNEIYKIAVKEKENHIEKLERELLVRDQTRSTAEHVAKQLRQQEKTWMSEISQWKSALADMTNERNIFNDQLRALQDQLEKERKDRSRWATARLKLLAEFCDEENKLSSALQHQRVGSHRSHFHPQPLFDLLHGGGDGEEEGRDGGGIGEEDLDDLLGEKADDLEDQEDQEDNNSSSDDVSTAVMAAGDKMDAVEQRLHGGPQGLLALAESARRRLRRRRTRDTSAKAANPSIVFG